MCASLATYYIHSIHCTSCVLVYRLNGNLYCAVSVQGMEGIREVPVAIVQNKEIFKEFINFSGGLFHIFSTLLNLKFWSSTNLFISDLAVLCIHLTT